MYSGHNPLLKQTGRSAIHHQSKEIFQVWNNRVSEWRQNFHCWVNYSFNSWHSYQIKKAIHKRPSTKEMTLLKSFSNCTDSTNTLGLIRKDLCKALQTRTHTLPNPKFKENSTVNELICSAISYHIVSRHTQSRWHKRGTIRAKSHTACDLSVVRYCTRL